MLNSAATECIQIKASNSELDKRISAFMERKRAESDVFNIQEFCHRLPLDGSENSCARTEAVLISRKDSKSHLKVSRCVNMWGPQTHSEVPALSSATTQLKPTPAIQERLQNMEKHLGLVKEQPIPLDVYGRLKALEDRILHLESISPEYFNGSLNVQPNNRDDEDMMAKIDQRMEELRRKLL